MQQRRDLVACLLFAVAVLAFVGERQVRSGDVSGRSLVGVRRPYALVGVLSGKCLAANGAITAGARMQIETCNGSANQQFQLQARGERSYRLRNLGTGMCVDVQGADENAGAAVIQFPCTGGRNQRWWFSRFADDVYELAPLHSGFRLDVKDARVADGAELIQWYPNNSSNQRFRLVPAAAVR